MLNGFEPFPEHVTIEGHEPKLGIAHPNSAQSDTPRREVLEGDGYERRSNVHITSGHTSRESTQKEGAKTCMSLRAFLPHWPETRHGRLKPYPRPQAMSGFSARTYPDPLRAVCLAHGRRVRLGSGMQGRGD